MKKSALLFSIITLSFSSMAQDITPADYSAYILTPKAPDTPRINGP